MTFSCIGNVANFLFESLIPMMVTHVFIFCVYFIYQFAGCVKMLRVQIVVFLVVTSHTVVNEYRRFVKTSSK